MSEAVELRLRPPSDHVPPALLWGRDLDAFAAELDDPYLGAARLHDGPDIVWGMRSAREGWIVTRLADQHTVFMDHGRFSARNNSNVQDVLGVPIRNYPLDTDPPDHLHYRRVIQPYFTPKAIDRLEPLVRQICDKLIARFEDDGGCEFVNQFSRLFPSYVFLTMMGMPLDRSDQFLEWSAGFFRGQDQDRVTALRTILDYLKDYVAERRTLPEEDDLTGAIIRGQIGGRAIDEEEILGTCLNLYLGGLDTVMSSLGWYFRHLACDPALQARLYDNPQDIPAAAEEFLRAFGITATRRQVIADTELNGVLMRRGDNICLPTYLSSRDARQFVDPHRIDIDRDTPHMTLATGAHNCVGQHLARREIRVVLEAFIGRFRNIRMSKGETASWTNRQVWAVTRLPLAWDRR
jgi:cytochrome P450